MFRLRSTLMLVVMLSFAAGSSEAGLIVTIEQAGQQTASSSITNQQVQTFDSINTGSYSKPLVTTVGTGANQFTATYSSNTEDPFFILGADSYGGAGGTGHYIVAGINGTTSLSLKLSVAQSYFGLWWSAGDIKNALAFYSGNTLMQSFSTNSDFFKNLTDAYYGNPNHSHGSVDGGEPFAFINFFGTRGTTFDKIVFSNDHSTGFESDNHTFSVDPQTITGTTLLSVSTPEPTTLASATVAALITGLWLRRKKRVPA